MRTIPEPLEGCISYHAEIDGLRAIAVGAVNASHASARLRGGFLGVDIISVILGLLIAFVLAGEIAEYWFSLAHVSERRASAFCPRT